VAKSGAAVRGRARQADSEDTVTISGQSTPDDGIETDDESAPAKRVSQFSFYLLLVLHRVRRKHVLSGLYGPVSRSHDDTDTVDGCAPAKKGAPLLLHPLTGLRTAAVLQIACDAAWKCMKESLQYHIVTRAAILLRHSIWGVLETSYVFVHG